MPYPSTTEFSTQDPPDSSCPGVVEISVCAIGAKIREPWDAMNHWCPETHLAVRQWRWLPNRLSVWNNWCNCSSSAKGRTRSKDSRDAIVYSSDVPRATGIQKWSWGCRSTVGMISGEVSRVFLGTISHHLLAIYIYIYGSDMFRLWYVYKLTVVVFLRHIVYPFSVRVGYRS